MTAARCDECGEPVAADPAGSAGVWTHDPDAIGDSAYDLDEHHAARPPEHHAAAASQLAP